MIPYPFLYIDEKLLKRDIKEAVKVYGKILKVMVKIAKVSAVIEKCSISGKGCSDACIKAQDREYILWRIEDSLCREIREITTKWRNRPDFIRKQLDSIEVISIAGRCYTVGFIQDERRIFVNDLY